MMIKGPDDEPPRRVALDLDRQGRRQVLDQLMVAMYAAENDPFLIDDLPEDDGLPPVGVDGRPATIIPIRED